MTLQKAKKLNSDFDLKEGIFPVKKGIIIWDWKSENRHILLSSEDISKRVVELGASITEYYKDETVTVLALTNGALV